MNRHLFRTMQLLAAFFSILIFFPIETVLLILPPKLLYGQWGTLSVQSALLGFLGLFTISLLGRGWAYMLDQKWRLSPLKRRLLTVFPVLLLGAGVCRGLMSFFSLYEAIVWAVLASAAFVVGSVLCFIRYEDLIGFRLYGITAGCYLAALLIFSAAHYHPLTARPFAALLLIQTVILLFGLNQSNMDFMMRRRHHRADQLPQKIRSYNLRLIATVAVVLILLLVLYRPIAAGISALGSGLLAVLRWIVRVLSMLFSGSSEDPLPDISSAAESKETESLGNLPPGTASPFWDYFGYLILALLIIYILYHSKRIMQIVKRICEQIWKMVLDLLTRQHPRPEASDDEGYIDTEERLEPKKPDLLPPDKAPAAWRIWRRNYRRYCAMPDTEARARTGYRLMLQWLKMQDVPFRGSSTPLEIAETARSLLDFTDLDPATDQYDRIRYDDPPPALHDADQIDRILSEMAHTKTAVRVSRLARAMRKESNP